MSKLRGLPAKTMVLMLLGLMTAVVVTYSRSAEAAVTQEVRLDTPIALDGQVWAVEQVGNAVVVGGNFTRVQVERGGEIVNQAGLYAYDLDSGQFLADFRPTLGTAGGLTTVRDIEPAADGESFYIGGRFTTINDGTDGRTRTRNRIARLNLDGRLDRTFALGGVDAQVLSLSLGADNNLYVGGNFTQVFDLAVDRPPILQEVGGLVRLDGTTGAFDEGFRYDSVEPIGAPIRPNGTTGRFTDTPDDDLLTPTFGVSRVEIIGRRLLVAHRGAAIFDRGRGTTHDAAGLALLAVDTRPGNDTFHWVTGFRALHPDPNDAVQSFYHSHQCGGRGVQIRDIDFQGSWAVVVHQGGDSGVQCDTAVRFPIRDTPARPDWVSRVFDSVFSVEVDGDDVYIGGHFRVLVHPSAPSPYPGIQRASRELTLQTYNASYTGTSPASILFQEDLVAPGYVFPVGQLGLLDAQTGYGDPEFLPQSDALLGVLELTAVDRGLLLGQDRSRINDFNVGRSAFFDNTPELGQPRCSVELNRSGNPVVSWNSIGNVSQWNIAADGTFVGSVDGGQSEFEHGDVDRGTDVIYELRYNRNGLSHTDSCGSVSTAQLVLACRAEVVDGETQISWDDEGWRRISVRRDGSFLTDVEAGTTEFSEPAIIGTSTYSVRAFISGEQFDASCGAVEYVRAPITCTAVLAGDAVTVSWTGDEWNRVVVRANDRALVEATNPGSQVVDAPVGQTQFGVRAFIDGEQFNAECGAPITVDSPPLTCSVAVAGEDATVSWNDESWDRVSIRRNEAFVGQVDAGVTTFTEPVQIGQSAYSLRAFIDGTQVDANCGQVAFNGPTPVQLACTQTSDGTNTVLSWNDVGSRSYQVRTAGAWVGTVGANETSFTVADTGDVHSIRYRVGGEQFDVTCSN